MKLVFFRRTGDLGSWERRGFPDAVLHGPRSSDDHDRHAAVVANEPPGDPQPDGPFRLAASAIMAYDIFPPSLAQRVVRRTPVQVGDTVGLRYPLLPGIGMFIASRVIDVFDGQANGVWRAGFTYRTLEGHAELGEETFAVEKDLTTGVVTASLTAWSRPGHWLTRIGYWYARWCQLHAGRSALRHLQEIADGASACPDA